MSSKPALKVSELAKVYQVYGSPTERLRELLFPRRRHTVVTALQPTSFEVQHGEVLGILGRNGAGKSTLLQMLAGTLTPSSGNVELDGKITALLELGSGFNPDFTGRDNVFLYGAILGLTRKQVSEQLNNILEFADIGEFIDRPLKTYSSGMRVRLAFSTVVGLDPEIIIVDEALAVGDAAFQLKCMRLISSLKAKGKTFVLVTHSVPQVVSFCTRAIVIEAGRVIFDGEPQQAAHVYKSMLFPDERERFIEQASSGDDVAVEAVAAASSTSGKKATRKKGPEKKLSNFVAESSEYRFGNGDAKIERVDLLGRNGNVSRVFVSHEQVTIRLTMRAKRDISMPVYGFRIRNFRGLDVYIKHTQGLKTQVSPIIKNQVHQVSFSIDLALLGGEYFVSCGLSEEVGTEIVPLDRRMDVLQITVISTDNAAGIANLSANFCDHLVATDKTCTTS
ncbi:MAG: ABC transporter ATP-binding protein [Pseudomonadales bacterium]